MNSNKIKCVAEVRKDGSRMRLYEIHTGKLIGDKVLYSTRKRAMEDDCYVAKVLSNSGKLYWRRLKKKDVPEDYSPLNDGNGSTTVTASAFHNFTAPVESDMNVDVNNLTLLTDDEIRKQIAECKKLKPETLVIDELNWRLAIRGVLRGENILLLGHSGCGKTLTATSLAQALERPFFKFNMGATQDARAALVGNTHYAADKGTFFAGSEFVRAISTPFSIVYLDEITRMSPDAENILMTVLDRDQRYMRIDEDPRTPTIKVAPGVTFVATANVGAEYTATRVLDRATMDRWSTIVELKLLSKQQEVSLMKKMFPQLNRNYIEAFADVCDYTRKNITSDNPTLSTIISTRMVHEQCKLAMDGFRWSEVCEGIIFQLFDPEGGVGDSERTEIRSKVQEKSHLDNESPLISEMRQKEKEEKVEDKKEEGRDPFSVNEDIMGY